MKASEIKKIVENRFQELGASKILLSPSDYCWEFQGEDVYKRQVLGVSSSNGLQVSGTAALGTPVTASKITV